MNLDQCLGYERGRGRVKGNADLRFLQRKGRVNAFILTLKTRYEETDFIWLQEKRVGAKREVGGVFATHSELSSDGNIAIITDGDDPGHSMTHRTRQSDSLQRHVHIYQLHNKIHQLKSCVISLR